MTTLLAISFAVAPLLGLIALLRIVDRVEQRSQERYERQIVVTEAIHRELGAVVAPVVYRRHGGGWIVEMAVPLDRPAAVATILRIADSVFESTGEDYELALTRQRIVRRAETAYRRAMASGTPARRAA
jgi:hypothetical protein